MKKIPILFAIDSRIILPTCICLSSLLRNSNPDTFYDIFIIHSNSDRIEDSEISQIPHFYSNCQITFRSVGDDFAGVYEVRGISKATYYRLLAAELIPEYDKILYSDVDVIFRCDQSMYYEMNVGNNYFGAVDNYLELRPDIHDYVSDVIKLDPRNGYFYAGNLVMNLKQMRQDNICDVFRKLSRNNYEKQDMDIINIACNNRFYDIKPEFCLTVQLHYLLVFNRQEMLRFMSDDEIDFALKYGTIHYNGDKPWNTWCHHFDYWWEEYRKSPFYDEEYYTRFYDNKYGELDKLPFIKRVKLLINYFRR